MAHGPWSMWALTLAKHKSTPDSFQNLTFKCWGMGNHKTLMKHGSWKFDKVVFGWLCWNSHGASHLCASWGRANHKATQITATGRLNGKQFVLFTCATWTWFFDPQENHSGVSGVKRGIGFTANVFSPYSDPRKKSPQDSWNLGFQIFMCVCMYVYMYIYTYRGRFV